MNRLAVAVWLFLAILAGQAQAHDLRPAYLAITESTPDVYSVLWKVPALDDRRLAIYPRLPKSAAEAAPRDGVFLSDAYVERWTVRAPSGFAGETISIDGLAESRTDVLVRIERLNGETSTTRLTPASPSFEVPAATGWRQVAAAYLWLGVEHILFGLDHLLFVASLMLIVRNWRTMVKTITAFTVAHSITLTFATLGWVTLPAPPVETLIALSILLVATEIVRMERGQLSLTITRPWVVAFAFGLLHGFGFAGALVKIGLPQGDVPLALLAFNAGVEIGQLMFIAAVLVTVHSMRRIFTIPRQAIVVSAYAIGAVASFWTIERLSTIFLLGGNT